MIPSLSTRLVRFVPALLGQLVHSLFDRPLACLCGVAVVMVVLAACTVEAPPQSFPSDDFSDVMAVYSKLYDPEERLGPRPAEDVQASVEFYLRRYQPGPLPRLFQTTEIYDRNGTLLAELFDEGRRTWVSLDRISPYLRDATVAVEDASFYTNRGIDPKRLVGAAMQNAEAKEIVSGASTITMQLARNLFLVPDTRYDQTVNRKMLEIELAQELNTLFSKDELLEMYLNLANYAHLTYGPEAAAQTYFGKAAADLDLAEATLLAAIPQRPADLDLFENFEGAKQRQRTVLDLMVRHGYLSADEADAVYVQPVTLIPEQERPPVRAPHFVQYMKDRLADELAIDDLGRAGLRITTTLDLAIQTLAETTVAQGVERLRPRYGMTNGALVAMKPGSAEVLAMVGSVDFYDESIDGQVNVTLSPRQPGSALKPILYATAFNDNLISPATVIWDTPSEYMVGVDQIYRPRNYDGRFHGMVTARSALANSYNVPAVKLVNALSVKRFLESARQMGIRTFRDDFRYGMSVVLGSAEVSLLDLTTVFHTLANSGRYLPPQILLSATDNAGRELVRPAASVQTVSAAAAFQVTDILSDNAARTPAFGSNSALRLSRPAAAKTGTTTDWRDNWTVGFTRYLVAGVWTGNSNGRPMRGSSGAAGAAPIWRSFMEAMLNDPALLAKIDAPEESEKWAFVPPADVVQLPDCPPNFTCPATGEYFSQSWLDSVGAANPLAGTTLTAPVVPVHRDRAGNAYWPAYCTAADGAGQERTLFSISGQVGITGPLLEETKVLSKDTSSQIALVQAPGLQSLSTSAETETERASPIYYPDSELERFRLLAWNLRNRIPSYLGPCRALNYYTVEPGDSWSKMARRVGLSVAALQGANPQALRQQGVLRPGDRLLLPTGIPLVATDRSDYYIVQLGDSWVAIADRFDLPVRLLLVANPDLNRANAIIQPGDRMFIPELADTFEPILE